MTRYFFAVFLLSCMVFSLKRLLRYLRYLQQDNYYPGRFLKWLWTERAFDTRGSAIIIAVGVFSTFSASAFYLAGSLLLLTLFFTEEDPRRAGKLKLSMTARAKRIYLAAASQYLLLQLIVGLMNASFYWPSQLILFQLLPFFLAGSVLILSFDEKRRQTAYRAEAAAQLKRVSPFVIGITGSYGKTSTKDALANILNVSLGPTFWPHKGVNTEMGITREVRDKLYPGTQYAVVEMAAYGKGSIARLCRLTPPHAAILTTIGVAHLDRFGSQEMILKTKAELAEALPPDGVLVCNGDNEGTRTISRIHRRTRTYLYGFDQTLGDLDCWISEFRHAADGTEFTFQWKGEGYSGRTALRGKAAVSNIAAAFTMACALGAQPALVIAAIANLQPVDNRLQVTKEKGVTYLRDAYNSNPDGFADALEVLSQSSGRKKFLMTPGMVELQAIERELHEKIGKKAAQVCDYAIIVGHTNRESLRRGLLSGGMPGENVVLADGREQAFEELGRRLSKGDAVLIENDLPDLYEGRQRF